MAATIHNMITEANFGTHLLALQPNVVPVSVSHVLNPATGAFESIGVNLGPVGAPQADIQPMFDSPRLWQEAPTPVEIRAFIESPSNEAFKNSAYEAIGSAAEVAILFQVKAVEFEKRLFRSKPTVRQINQHSDPNHILKSIATYNRADMPITAVIAGLGLKDVEARINFAEHLEYSAERLTALQEMGGAAITWELSFRNYRAMLESKSACDEFGYDDLVEAMSHSARMASIAWHASAEDFTLPLPVRIVDPKERAEFRIFARDRMVQISRAIYFAHMAGDLDMKRYANLFYQLASDSIFWGRYSGLTRANSVEFALCAAYYAWKADPVSWFEIESNLLIAEEVALKIRHFDKFTLKKLRALTDAAETFPSEGVSNFATND